MSFLTVIEEGTRIMHFGVWPPDQMEEAQAAADRKGPGLVVATCHVEPFIGPELVNPPLPEPPVQAWRLSEDGNEISVVPR